MHQSLRPAGPLTNEFAQSLDISMQLTIELLMDFLGFQRDALVTS